MVRHHLSPSLALSLSPATATATLDCAPRLIDIDRRVSAIFVLADLLEHPKCSIKNLILRSNRIGPRGCAMLSEALLHNSTVERLDLHGNRLYEVRAGYQPYNQTTTAAVSFLTMPCAMRCCRSEPCRSLKPSSHTPSSRSSMCQPTSSDSRPRGCWRGPPLRTPTTLSSARYARYLLVCLSAPRATRSGATESFTES